MRAAKSSSIFHWPAPSIAGGTPQRPELLAVSVSFKSFSGFFVQKCPSKDKIRRNSASVGADAPPLGCSKLLNFLKKIELASAGLGVALRRSINSMEGSTNENADRHHVQKNACAENSAACVHLQTVRDADLLAGVFKSSSGSARPEKSLNRYEVRLIGNRGARPHPSNRCR